MTVTVDTALLRTAGSHVVECGGRLVHLQVAAGEGPPILLLGGCAVPSYAFGSVVAALGGRWLVSLDRPGMLETPWPGRLPTLDEEVATLAELCAALGEPPVVVAHSMAGPHVEALVREQPGSVRGLALLDASIEVDARAPRAATERLWLAASRITLAGARLRPFAALASLSARVMVWTQSRRLRLTYTRPPRGRGLWRRPDTLAMVVAEQAAYAAQLADLQRLMRVRDWPGTPALVLTAGSRPGWVRKQRVLARRLGARQVVVDDSRHLMMVDRPDLVVDAVLALVRDGRAADAHPHRSEGSRS